MSVCVCVDPIITKSPLTVKTGQGFFGLKDCVHTLIFVRNNSLECHILTVIAHQKLPVDFMCTVLAHRLFWYAFQLCGHLIALLDLLGMAHLYGVHLGFQRDDLENFVMTGFTLRGGGGGV